jgi:Ni,Fe-hydrogenase III large subunit
VNAAVVKRIAKAELEELEARAWRDHVAAELRAGARAITLFGRSEGEQVVVTAVLESTRGELLVSRTALEPHVGYHALTADFPCMHAFERELHEQHHVRVGGHPWLKPIRFEHSGAKGRDAYPYYEVLGKEVHEVAVGPVHAGVIEPGSFRFMCLGELVYHLEIQLGYQHRGVESLLTTRDALKLGPLVETIAGDTSVGHGWAYAAALEALLRFDCSAEVDASRGLMLELERVAMHLAGLAGLAADVGSLEGASTFGRLRTLAINTSMRLSGSRFGRGAVRPCGSGVGIGAEACSFGGESLETLSRTLELLTGEVALMSERFFASRTVVHRLEGVGILPEQTARQIGLVGLAARASGDARDVRANAGGVYAAYPIKTHVESAGDCLARARVRAVELARSLDWLRAVAQGYSRLERSRGAHGELCKNTLSIALVEGFRGEVVHVLETGDDGTLLHYKVQDPSLRNWFGLAQAMRDNDISDFPICNKSFDLSYCGHDL